jgi:hypothetical protein
MIGAVRLVTVGSALLVRPPTLGWHTLVVLALVHRRAADRSALVLVRRVGLRTVQARRVPDTPVPHLPR